jgi:phenylalanine-4-hydroxylase
MLTTRLNKFARPFCQAAKAKSFEVTDKQGLVFTLTDKPGILNDALLALSKHQINLSRIESKPSKFYREEKAHDFYIDFYGNLEDNNVRNAIGELSRMSKHLTITGTP